MLVWLRGDALLSPALFNPDEAELLAEGKRAMVSLVPYREYTTPTFLFVWPLLLGLLGKLGLALTLSTAHFLSGIAYLFIIVAGWYTLSRYVHWLYALMCLTPAALALFANKAMIGSDWSTSDFYSLGTELLPLVLMSGALLLVHTGDPLRWRPRLAIGAALIGTSVLAKPQALPLAVGFLAASVLAVHSQETFANGNSRLVEERRVRDVATWAISFALAPVAAAIAWMAVGHTLHAFYQEPVTLQIDYVFRRSETQPNIVAATTGQRITSIGKGLSAIPFAYVILAAAGDSRHGPLLFGRGWPAGRRRRGLLVLGTVTLAAIVSAVVPSPLFPHYFNFVFGGCILAAVSSCAVLGPRSPRQVTTGIGTYRPALLIAALATVMSALILTSSALDHPRHGNMRWGALFDSTEAVPRAASGPAWDTMRSRCPPGERVMVWGWASELYSYNDWIPATRYANTWVLLPLTNRAVYARRLEHALIGDPPRCMVEAIGPSFFGEYDRNRGVAATLPGLAGLLERCYTRHVANTTRTGRVGYYARRVGC